MRDGRHVYGGADHEAILESRRPANAPTSRRTSRIPHQPDRVTAPLSAAQRRIWLLHEFDPASPVWNRPVAVRVEGPLNRVALRRALNEIVRRHAALRTIIQVDDGEPRQIVLPHVDVPLQLDDLRAFPRPEREMRARQVALEESQQAFDLAAGPMVRARLLQLADDAHVLLVLMHHVAFDGWSETLLLDELRVLHRAFAEGRQSPLPDLPIQYADFAVWQNDRRTAGEVDRQLEYWQTQLAGAPRALALRWRDSPSEGARYRGITEERMLPAALSDQLRRFCRQERVSLFMVLMMTFQLLLARYADQDDIVVGVPVAGRIRSETEKLIGCFMNVLVFRADLSGDPTVRELLAGVRKTALGAFANQEVTFDQLVERLQPERSVDRWPLFQVMFQLRNLPQPSAGEPGELRFEPFEYDREVIGGLDLSLQIEEHTRGLRCWLTYRTGRFDGATAQGLLGHFHQLLEGVVRDPDERAWALPMLTEAERRQLLVDWNDTHLDMPRDACIHRLVERQVDKTPRAVAVVSSAGTLTYAELNRKANGLAWRLKRIGVGPETLVGLCGERSPEMVVALLAVLKAGGAYVPLNPSDPVDRLSDIVASAGLRLLLATREAPVDLTRTVGQVVYLDTDSRGHDPGDEENPESGAGPEHLAYVLHTSGSTGTPKGVMVTHRSVCNYLFWRQHYFPLGQADRVLQRAAYTFDDSVWEVFEPLMVGASTVLAQPGRESDTDHLIDLILKERITACCLVPSQLSVFLDDPRAEACTTLRRVTTGGEVLPPEVHDRFLSRFGARLYNTYGPTEATIACTCHACDRLAGPGTVPIGRPIANTQVYVVGRHLQPVPVGVTGELCVAGDGLARGYLNDPQLTAKRFVPNPFSHRPGARLYRTGDLACHRPDGNLEFLGRVDRQVKIRGYRVELGEVEAALAAHPDLQAAAVTVRRDAAGRQELVGYLVARGGPRPTVEQLRAFVGRRLAAYMQPTRWVFLERMPVSSSGKVDRGAFPEPRPERADEGGPYLAPRSPVEREVAQLWARVLGFERVGIRDNFFDLGGHSLLAVSLFAQVKREFGVQLPLSTIFEAPTVEAFARLVGGARASTHSSVLVPVRGEGNRPPLFGLHPANGRPLMYGALARHLADDQPVFALQSVGLDGAEPPLERVEHMARRYLSEIRSVQPRGPYHLVGFCLGATIAFEIARQLRAEGEEVALLAVVSHDAEWQAASFAGGMRRHLGRVWRLEPPQRRAYLAGRLRYRYRRIRGAAVDGLSSVCAAIGRPIPRALQALRVAELNHRAGLRYVRTPLPVHIDYFEGSHDLHKGGASQWASCATRGVVTHVVAGRGAEMFREPHVRGLASALAGRLSTPSGPDAPSRSS